MEARGDSHLEAEQQRAWRREYWRLSAPFVLLLAAMMLGVLASGLGWPMRVWGVGGGVAMAGMIALLAMRRWHSAMAAGLLAAAMLMAGYTALHSDYVAGDDLIHYLSDERQLAAVRGRIASTPQHRDTTRGALARFHYADPSATRFELDVDALKIENQWQPASGRLMLRVRGDATDELAMNQPIQAQGWMHPIAETANPGEFDYRGMLAQRSIHAQLNVPDQSLVQPFAERSRTPSSRDRLATLRQRWMQATMRALRSGMEQGSEELILLEAIVLGQRDPALRQTYERFRTVGLAHLMAISGAHLGILMGLAWVVARLVMPTPRWTAVLLLAVLFGYVLALPLRVPILRAAIMAGVFCVGYASGRLVTGLGLLSLAGVIVLLMNPLDLYSPGFQLSFGIVAALLLLTARTSQAIAPRHEANELQSPVGWCRRRGADVLAINVVAFFTALPVVAWHFELVSPYAIVWAVLALPVVALVLALGYVKMMLSLVVPFVASWLAVPAHHAAGLLLWLVEQAGRVPGAGIELAAPPPGAWVLASVGVTLAAFTGWFAQRKRALAACVVLLGGWLVASDPGVQRWVERQWGPQRMHVHVLSVGSGSAYVIELPEATLLFDAGSDAYAGVGEQTIVPALQRLGIRRIDKAFISHAHLDHYNGLIDVADAVPIDRVYVSSHFIEHAEQRPQTASSYLLHLLERRGLEPTPIARGWSTELGQAALQLHWPEADLTHRNPNERSLMLSITLGEARMLLTGDAERQAIERFKTLEPELRADVIEMPHHGEYTPATQALFEHVQPDVLLQSSGRAAMADDPWGDWLSGRDLTRLNTAAHGMLSVTLDADGTMHWQTHLQQPLLDVDQPPE